MSEAITKILTPAERFEENVKQKIRDDIGSLIPDEVLASFVQQTIQEIFFTPRKKKNPNYSYYGPDKNEWIADSTWFKDSVEARAKPLIESAITKAMEEHKDLITEAIQKSVAREPLAQMAAVVATSLISKAYQQEVVNGITALLEGLRQRGISV